jgi:Ni2+-binding GTPase involved in maturation of urease and hydrogenase
MEAARIHHLPLVDEGRLVGLWLATDEGPIVMLAPERAHEATPDADAYEAVAALLRGSEAVVVWGEGERPVGVLTRTDALRIMRSALALGRVGGRDIRPVVLRFVGPAGAGKSTLTLRTIERMRRCEVAVVQANAERSAAETTRAVAGAPVLDARDAHWRKGLQRCVELLGDAQLIIVEDRDGPPELGTGIGEDMQVLVVPPEELEAIAPETLKEAQALLITKLDVAPEGFDLEAVRAEMRVHVPHLPIFGVAALHDDRGLEEWQQWLEGRVLSRQH